VFPVRILNFLKSTAETVFEQDIACTKTHRCNFPEMDDESSHTKLIFVTQAKSKTLGVCYTTSNLRTKECSCVVEENLENLYVLCRES
jgi:hypothetical protein